MRSIAKAYTSPSMVATYESRPTNSGARYTRSRIFWYFSFSMASSFSSSEKMFVLNVFSPKSMNKRRTHKFKDGKRLQIDACPCSCFFVLFIVYFLIYLLNPLNFLPGMTFKNQQRLLISPIQL